MPASPWRACTPPGIEIALVLTQPDRPAGRGLKLQASPVKPFALEHGIPVAQPRSLRLDGKYPDDAAAAQAAMASTQADAMVVAAYGLILPQWVLDLPRHGCFNIHASLLPRWRGAAPIHRAIEAGDAETGVTIMQMDAGLDTGAMLLGDSVEIGPDTTSGSLQERLAALGAERIVEALAALDKGPLVGRPQPEAGVTYAHKIDKAEATIDWREPRRRSSGACAPSIPRRARAARSRARRSPAGAASSRAAAASPARSWRSMPARSPSPAARAGSPSPSCSDRAGGASRPMPSCAVGRRGSAQSSSARPTTRRHRRAGAFARLAPVRRAPPHCADLKVRPEAPK